MCVEIMIIMLYYELVITTCYYMVLRFGFLVCEWAVPAMLLSTA